MSGRVDVVEGCALVNNAGLQMHIPPKEVRSTPELENLAFEGENGRVFSFNQVRGYQTIVVE